MRASYSPYSAWKCAGLWSLKYIRTTIPKNRVTSGITSFDFTLSAPAAAEAESFRGDPAAIRAPRTRSLAGRTAAIGLTGMSNGGPMEATAAAVRACLTHAHLAGAFGTRMEHMTSATIKLFLPRGDAKSLRTAEISNWTGKAVAAPRTELDELLAREELDKAGVYILIGSDPLTNQPRAYIGEAEVIRDRLKQHRTKEFWVSAIVFVSKDENLTKAHVRYLESRLLAEAKQVNRFTLEQNEAGGSRLPESDREDMEVFLARIRQLLPVLGSDILVPITQPAAKAQPGGVLFCRIKGAEAQGQRTADGFVVFRASTAVLDQRPSADNYPYVVAQRRQLIADGTLIEKNGFLVFTKDAEFSSPSAAAVVIHGFRWKLFSTKS